MRLLPTPAGLNNRVGQDHVCIYTVYLRCSLQGIHQIYNHTACIYSSGQPYVLIRGRGGCGAQYSATTHPPCLLICTHVFICCFCLHSQGTGGDEEDVESITYPYLCFLLTFTGYRRGRGRCGEQQCHSRPNWGGLPACVLRPPPPQKPAACRRATIPDAPPGHQGGCVCLCLGTCRVGQSHIYTVYTRYVWQVNDQIYGPIRCIYTVWPTLGICVWVCVFVCVCTHPLYFWQHSEQGRWQDDRLFLAFKSSDRWWIWKHQTMPNRWNYNVLLTTVWTVKWLACRKLCSLHQRMTGN